jgi:hypothetical protein
MIKISPFFKGLLGVNSYQSLEELINIKMLPQLQENVGFLTQKHVVHDNV